MSADYHAGANKNEPFVKTFVMGKFSVVALSAMQFLRGKVPAGTFVGAGLVDGVAGFLAAKAAGIL